MPHLTSAILLAAAAIAIATAAMGHKTAATAAMGHKTATTFVLPNQFLSPHNTVRFALKLPPLTWDPQLTRYAESYALRRHTDCALVHSDGPYGENIFWGSGSGWSPAQAVAAWAAEGRWYSIKSNTCAERRVCGHYTQIVWRATRRVGCASINCVGGRGQFMVCEYDPPGNYIGERPY